MQPNLNAHPWSEREKTVVLSKGIMISIPSVREFFREISAQEARNIEGKIECESNEGWTAVVRYALTD
jgi:hypothetical protein